MGKICSKCGVEKEVGEFCKNKKSKDGYECRCKECRRKLYNISKKIKFCFICGVLLGYGDKKICKDLECKKKLKYYNNCKSRIRNKKEKKCIFCNEILPKEKKGNICNKEECNKVKYCNFCKKIKNKEDFNKNNKLKDGYDYKCRICANLRKREIHRKNIKFKKCIYCGKILGLRGFKLCDSEECIKKHQKNIYIRMYKKHGDRKNKKSIEDRKLNNEKAIKKRKYRIKWEKERIKIDICYKIRRTISGYINKILKSNNSSKKGSSCLKFLPYTIQELREHLEKQFESWMNWGNHGVYRDSGERTWQIDHIIPCSKLPFDSMEHPNFLKCWCLENLRPLEAIKNLRKSNKIIGE